MLILGIGCSKQTASTPSPAPSPAPSAAAADDTALPALLGELTQAARKFGAEQQRVPTSLDELVTKGYLSRVPEAPAGKKFAIDKNLQVYLTKP